EHLAPAHVKFEALMHRLAPEARDQAAHANGDLGAHQSISKNQSANMASSRMTMKIACTTDVVTRLPSEPTSPPTESPCLQPITASTSANTGAFEKPTQKCCSATTSETRAKNITGLTPSADQHTRRPPKMPAIMAAKL